MQLPKSASRSSRERRWERARFLDSISNRARSRESRLESCPMWSCEFLLGSLERLFTLLPVARAQLVCLQRIEHAQYLFRVTSNVQIGDVDEANHTLRVH